MRSNRLRQFCASALMFALASMTLGQSTPFLTDSEIRMLRNEISGDRSYEHIRVLTQWHRDSGMEGYFKAMDYVAAEAKKNGLADVKIIPQPLSGNYTAVSGELWMTEPVELKLADIGDHALYLSDNSRDADIEADLVWGGNGTDEDLAGLDVKGKIVLINGNPGFGVANAVYKHGAAGVIAYTTSEQKSMLDFPDQIPWTRIPDPPRGTKGSFAFNLSPRKGDTLRRVLQTEGEQDFFATGVRAPGGKVKVRAKVDTKFGDENERTGTGMVEGWIRGTKYKDQQIVITAHLQEEQGSANDDGSGSGNILELARVFNKLIAEGKIPPPLRDIRFWWTDEIYSEYRYFRDNPGSEKQMLANLHQDMTGAKQSMGSRVQHLIHAPHSRTSYLDALFESIGEFVIKTNNAFITAGRQGGYERPFSQPIIATRGTREAYNARFVPYFASSDNLVFVEGAIGVPSVALINWDDYYIHSSDDDLGNIDQTQLQRNNFIVGAMAFYLAYAEAEDVPLLAAETYAQGARRLANDLHKALLIVEAREGLMDARNQIIQGGLREERALESMKQIAGNDEAANRSITRYLALNKTRTERMLQEIGEASGLGNEDEGDYLLSPPERAAKAKIPENAVSLEEYFSKRRNVPTSLHPVMRSEVFNFVDGKRSYLDIYHAVRAEAGAAGRFLYGEVKLDDVVKLLDANVESGALKLAGQ
ncbi:MAG: M28 family peptidase [Acidobacteriota bacterium]|nr:MAG: M28 family peptidase [Acidobacteriota bacterium]